MLRRHLILGLVLPALAVIALAMRESPSQAGQEEDRSKLIKFSHKFHLQDVGASCEDCHTSARTSKLSSDNLLAKQANCATCHEDQVKNNCTFCHTDEKNFVPFANPPREIIFSHEKHLSDPSVKCETCHQGLENVEYASAANLPAMETCNTCHDNRKAANICESCHTNFTTLLPKDHKVASFKKEHRQLVRVGSYDVSCQTCHTTSFCQDCHDGANLVNFPNGKDAMTTPSAKSGADDTQKKMVLQNVHGLNYRFTHGLDAKGRVSDCYSCHSQETFCASCHAEGGNLQSMFKPAWHLGADFVSAVPGVGGNRHAELARRDIEMCASCHDVQGQDPTCMLCHAEGIR
jgi:hypothetical protein